MSLMREPKTPSRRARNLALAAVAGQAGCATLGIVVVALFLGLWLDAQAGTRGLFAMGVLVLSIPVSLWVMVRIALSAVKRITPPQPQQIDEREAATHTEEGLF